MLSLSRAFRGKCLLFFLASLCFAVVSTAQNLVPNYSFEDDKCPTPYNGMPGQVELGLYDWYAAMCASPDVMTDCSSNANCSVPDVWFGHQHARTGTNYMGIAFYGTWYEYIGVQLTQPLVAGTPYNVEFYLSCAEQAQYATDDIGIYFSTTQIKCPSANSFAAGTLTQHTPQVRSTPGQFITDKIGWTKISAIYTPTISGEQYITIGYFKAWNTANFINFGTTGTSPRLYYYIDDVSVTVALPDTTIWTGDVDNDWAVAGNWTEGVPTKDVNAIIPTLHPVTNVPIVNYPILQGSLNAPCKGLFVYPNASISGVGISNLFPTIAVHGDFANQGVTDGWVHYRFQGDVPQTISGLTNYNNLEINNNEGVTILGGRQYVHGGLLLKEGLLTTANQVVIRSSNSRTGYVDDFTTNFAGTTTGRIIVERYINNPGNRFFYLGAPVNNGFIADWGLDFPITGMNGAVNGSQVIPTGNCSPSHLAGNSPYGTLFEYFEHTVTDCNLKGWHVLLSGNTVRGKGYIARIPHGTVVDLSGTPVSGPVVSTALTKTPANTTNSQGLNLISNPYPSSLEWLAVAAANPGITGTAYVYQTSGPLAGTYLPVSGTAGNPTVIGSSQAFFVETLADGNTVSFANGMRHSGASNVLRQATNVAQRLTATVAGNGFADRTTIVFGNDFTSSFDPAHDGRKLLSNTGQPSLFTTEQGERRSVQALPVGQAVVSMPLSLLPGANGSFTLSFDDLATFSPTAVIYLEDVLTGTWHNVMAQPAYSFTATVADAEGRFVLHFIPPAVVSTTDADCNGLSGGISVDLGIYHTQTGTFAWDDLMLLDDRNAVLLTDSNRNGLVSISGLSAASYSLQLVKDGWMVNVPVTVNAPTAVDAHIQLSETSLEVGDTLFIADLGTGAATRVWNLGNGETIAGTNAIEYIYTVPGTYAITLEAGNDNCAANDAVSVTVNAKTPLGMVELADGYALVYSHGKTVHVNLSVLAPNGSVKVYDVTGKRVFALENTVLSTTNQWQLNVPNGVYVVHLSLAGETIRQKVVLY